MVEIGFIPRAFDLNLFHYSQFILLTNKNTILLSSSISDVLKVVAAVSLV